MIVVATVVMTMTTMMISVVEIVANNLKAKCPIGWWGILFKKVEETVKNTKIVLEEMEGVYGKSKI